MKTQEHEDVERQLPEWIKPGQRVAVRFGNEVMTARIVTVTDRRIYWQSEKISSIADIDTLFVFTGGYRCAVPIEEEKTEPRVPWWRRISRMGRIGREQPSQPAARNQMTPDDQKLPGCGLAAVPGSVSEPSAKLWAAMQLKADMFDYLCWLEDFCSFRQAALDGKAGDYLVCASDGTTCWAKTYAEAVRVAMEHDKELHDATTSQNTEVCGERSSRAPDHNAGRARSQ